MAGLSVLMVVAGMAVAVGLVGVVPWAQGLLAARTDPTTVSASVQGTRQTAAAVAAATPTAETAPSSEPAPEPTSTVPAPVRTDEDGMPHSDTAGTGTWTAAPNAAAAPAHERIHTYYLQIEDQTYVDPTEVAQTVATVLNDERGWPGTKQVSFVQVDDPSQAAFTISIATPGTTDAMCAPMPTGGTWSCNNGTNVILNSDRWNYLVPWVPDVTTYRSYLVNHEVGHWLGHSHEYCGAAGQYAPVMQQQSKGLQGCVANPWATLDGQTPS